VSPVELQRITFEEIRAGTWNKAPDAVDANVRRDAVELASIATAPSIDARQPTKSTDTRAASDDDPIATLAADPGTPAPTPVALSELPPASAAAQPGLRAAAGFWVQLGVFRQREGAEGFHRRVAADLDWLAPLLNVFDESAGYRLQAGPYASRDEAQAVARRVRDTLKLVPMVVERR
jgi:rare lipoprotein A